jgi:hypothetical protein
VNAGFGNFVNLLMGRKPGKHGIDTNRKLHVASTITLK